ncbi:aromatic acid exporter family protein, partial [Staphylococcus epidermidis]
NNFIIMGVRVILVIGILLEFNVGDVGRVGRVSGVIIMGEQSGCLYVGGFFRFVVVMIGVLSCSVVNVIFLAAKFER